MTLLSLAVAIFMIANPIGSAPAFVALVKDFDFARQKKILLREACFSLLFAYFYLFLGEHFLKALQIQQYAVSISGGVVIFLVALYMIFPRKQTVTTTKKTVTEPFIVPIAAPLIAGGGVFTTIVVYLGQTHDYVLMSEAIALAWVFVILITYSAAYLQKILGKGGLIALEQLMGMLLMMMAVELITRGAQTFNTMIHAT